MAKKGVAGRAVDLAQTAVNLKNVIKAFMHGGFAAGAMAAIKHFWPYILAAALILLLLPVIIFCCLPIRRILENVKRQLRLFLWFYGVIPLMRVWKF